MSRLTPGRHGGAEKARLRFRHDPLDSRDRSRSAEVVPVIFSLAFVDGIHGRSGLSLRAGHLVVARRGFAGYPAGLHEAGLPTRDGQE